MAHLVVVEGPNSGKIYPLYEKNLIGSVVNDNIVIHDRRIESAHISIEKSLQGYLLASLIPDKKIKVNGERVKKTYLRHGDIITIADTMLLYIDEETETVIPETRGIFPVFSLEDYSSMIMNSLEMKQEESTSSVPSEILHCLTPPDYRGILNNSHSAISPKLRTLIDISTAISEIEEVDLLLKRILAIVLKEFPADRGFIVLIGDDRKCAIKTFLQRKKQEFGRLDYSKKITRRVLAKRMSILYNKTNLHEGKESPLSCLSIPLKYQEKILGLIQLEAFGTYRFTHDDLEQLRKVALQTAIAVENLSIYQQPIYYRQHLIALERFSQSLSSYLDKESIIKEAVKAAKSLFHSDRISILLLDEEKDKTVSQLKDSSKTAHHYLKFAYSTGIPEEEWKKTSIPTNSTLAGRVFERGKPLLITDTTKIPPELRNVLPKNAYHSQSCILAPVQVTSYQASLKKKRLALSA